MARAMLHLAIALTEIESDLAREWTPLGLERAKAWRAPWATEGINRQWGEQELLRQLMSRCNSMSFAVYTAGGGCMIDQHAIPERRPVPCFFGPLALPGQIFTINPSAILYCRQGMANALVPRSPRDRYSRNSSCFPSLKWLLTSHAHPNLIPNICEHLSTTFRGAVRTHPVAGRRPMMDVADRLSDQSLHVAMSSPVLS